MNRCPTFFENPHFTVDCILNHTVIAANESEKSLKIYKEKKKQLKEILSDLLHCTPAILFFFLISYNWSITS